MNLRPGTAADFPSVLALNDEHVRFLSPLTAERLPSLVEASAWYTVVEVGGEVAAFLLAFRERAAYHSVNYLWFEQRYPAFLYIDRVAVAVRHQSCGIASELYRQVIAWATERAVPNVVCEYDIEPPNPASARFHARFGFTEVGRQQVSDGKKEVSLQLRQL
jgi:predicted GNAT superfamily acetyltransferase